MQPPRTPSPHARRALRWATAGLATAITCGSLALPSGPAEAASIGHRFPLSKCPDSWTYSSYRNHPTYGAHGAGLAIDLNRSGDHGRTVYATYDGTVTSYVASNGQLTLRHPSGTYTRYAHMESIPSSLRPGKKVKRGQQIGRVGGVGAGGSRNAHLHYEQLNANGSARTIKFQGKAISYPWKRNGSMSSFTANVPRSWCAT